MIKHALMIIMVWILIPLQLAAKPLPLPSSCRIPNRPPGQCVWSCLETLGRAHHIVQLEGLVDWHEQHQSKIGVNLDWAARQLTKLEVKHKCQEPGTPNCFDFIKAACDKGLGCVLGVNNYPVEGAYHAILGLDIDDKYITIWDPNTPDWKYYWTRQHLDTYWQGWAIVISE